MNSLPPPLPSETLYWIRGEDREEYGPVTLAELKEWAGEDRAGNGTWVRKQLGDWSLWESYPELVALLSSDVSEQASFRSRFIAFLIDYTILVFTVSFAFILAWGDHAIFQTEIGSIDEMIKSFQTPAYAEMSLYMKLIMEGAHVIYFGYFLGRPFQTLGKKIMGIRVVDAEGRPLTWARAFLRALASVISLQFIWSGYWIALFNPGLRTLHDWLVQTRVVKLTSKKERDDNGGD
ncbi:MAG: RDD family protein [Verrucomicrobiota bacterium]